MTLEVSSSHGSVLNRAEFMFDQPAQFQSQITFWVRTASAVRGRAERGCGLASFSDTVKM